MGKYIHLFETNAEFQAMYNDDEKYIEPWTSYTRETDSCGYNKKPGPLKFQFHDATNITFYQNIYADISQSYVPVPCEKVMVSKNGGEWISITAYTESSLSVVSGDTLEFIGDYASYKPYICGYDGCDWYDRFGINLDSVTLSGEQIAPRITISGNIMSLINSKNYNSIFDFTEDYALAIGYLFNNFSIVDMSSLLMPATGLSEFCYYQMFSRNSNNPGVELADTFAVIPELPANSVYNGCYSYMFENSPVTSATLPAASIGGECYAHMFYGCNLLAEITVLATSYGSLTLSADSMLYGAGEDVTAPVFHCANQTSKTDFENAKDRMGCSNKWTFDVVS